MKHRNYRKNGNVYYLSRENGKRKRALSSELQCYKNSDVALCAEDLRPLVRAILRGEIDTNR